MVGITFRYTPEGIPEGLCRAERLYYVTTAGGDFFPEQYGFGYIQALAQNFYHIKDVKLIKATGLDIEGAPVEKNCGTVRKRLEDDSHGCSDFTQDPTQHTQIFAETGRERKV